MHIQYFVGLDVHKQVVAFCTKKADGEIVAEGKAPSPARRTPELGDGSAQTVARRNGSHIV